ncbi:DUF2806 domain-containing protein [Pseudescherichia vulneris]|uniref:DUF2806 domain-containing protein n=1 Tax=Pseudescherichia vulneris TaxID=566 RepID=UPI0028B04D4A|nr:DUF2806 domain-containing protein [Pseudescherichia vulneris]
MSLIDFSFSGLSKPGIKLIDKVGDAIGVLYEPTNIRRLAKAQADAKRTELVSKLQLEGIEKRAVERFLKRETKRQENIESITIQAAQNLTEIDNVSDIDENWIEAFFKECEDINDEQMQSLWAKILSEEVKSKGSFSRRTLKLLSTLNKEEADLITFFGKFIWQAANLTPIILEDDNGRTKGISFDQLALLDSLGVIQQGFGFNLTYSSRVAHTHYYDKVLLLEFKSPNVSEWVLNTGPAVLTPIGFELMKICGASPDYEYLNDFIISTNVEDSPVKVSIVNI